VIAHVRHVRPIYGYGWSGANGSRLEVPAPFRLGCDTADAEHGVVLGEHEFSGATAYLSPRHTTDDGLFSVDIRHDGMLVASGYAEA